MKRLFLPSTLVCLVTSFLFLSGFKSDRKDKPPVATAAVEAVRGSDNVPGAAALEAASNRLYDSLQLSNIGLSRAALNYAYRGHQYMAENGMLENTSILTVCDFSQPSSSKRMYIIDVENYRVLVNTYVAHGKNSGLQYAERFSNRPQSNQSSLGFYVTKGTYYGAHGRSLKLSGKESGFNDNAEARAVVLHGATYIGDNKLGAPYMGRSFGCPAVPQELAQHIIDIIKEGTCLFIYKPDHRYLNGSRILNG